ncbi:hypothetical protein AB0L71_28545 [Streptomyces sp. NPDC052052]|uniref:hypothetical protein n=1 Tax=Streptomyces sp. NPDC052052 TaxID=3154756 RepID=UPI0034388E40
MTSKPYSASSVRQLAALVERIAPRDPARWDGRQRVPGAGGVLIQVSRQRADQLWMVVGMMDRAVQQTEVVGPVGRVARKLFTWQVLEAFWELAVAGELRARARDRGVPLPVATQRVVRDCLALLAGVVLPGKDVRLPVVTAPDARATTTPVQELKLFRFLVDLAGQVPVGHDGQSKQVNADYRVRLLAVTAVVLDTRSRLGELAAMRVADLGEGLESVRVRRRQQNGAHLEPVEVLLPLQEGTRVALRRWLEVRERLVYSLEGAATALWVSVAASNRGEPPGIPLSAQSLGASYVRGVRQLNGAMAGAPGWEPLPARLEGLRRALIPEAEEEVRRVRAEREAAERPVVPLGRPPGPVRHGCESGYTNSVCGCADCAAASRKGRAARRRRATLTVSRARPE